MDNIAAQRKRPGRLAAKLTIQSEQQEQQPTDSCAASAKDEVEPSGISPPLIDVDNPNTSSSPLLDSTTPSTTSGAECRRSSRKKIIKFDVRDLLNKNRKPHKIQIEARIDSNAPTPPPQLAAASSSRQAVGPLAVGDTVAAFASTSSTTAAELTTKQKTFIEKSAIFRRYSISAEQQSKISTAMRSPFPAVVKKAGNQMQVHVDTAKIAQARRLSRTQEIFNASMMKSKQNSSLIIAQMESNSCSSSNNSTLAMERRMTLSAAVNEAAKRRGPGTKVAVRGARQPYYEQSITSEKSSSSSAGSTNVQRKRGRPPKNKNTNVSSVNVSRGTSLVTCETLEQKTSKASTKQSQLTPEKAKNWREYKACFSVSQAQPQQETLSTRSQITDEVLEISSSSESESDSIQSPGSDESFTLNEPSTSKRRSKQRNFAAVSFMQEITSKLSDNVSAPEFIVASVDEIHSEPLTPCNSMTNLHDSQLLATAESANKIVADVQAEPHYSQVLEPVEPSPNTIECPIETNDNIVISDVVHHSQEKCHKKEEETPIRRKASSSSSESESNSERSQSKPFKRGDKLRVSLKRLSAQELSLSSPTTSISPPSSPTSSSGKESSSIKEDSSDKSVEHKKSIRKRSKRLLLQELEKTQIGDGSSSLEENETKTTITTTTTATAITTNEKKKIKRCNLKEETETIETIVADEKLEILQTMTHQEGEPKNVVETDATAGSKSKPPKKIEKAIEENPQTSKKELNPGIRRQGVEQEGEKKIKDIDLLRRQEKEDVNKIEKPNYDKSEKHSEIIEKKKEKRDEKSLSSSGQLSEKEAVGKINKKLIEANTFEIAKDKTSADVTEEETKDEKVKNESNFENSQRIEKPQNKESKNITGIKELSVERLNIPKKDQSESESQDEIEKLNREIENEIAKEIKDLINKDIEKKSENEIEAAINSLETNIKQLNKTEIDDLKAKEALIAIEEQRLNKKALNKGKKGKVSKGEVQSTFTNSEQEDDNKTSDSEVIARKQEDLKDKQQTQKPPEKDKSQTIDKKESLTPEKEVDNNEHSKRKLRSATPPESKSKDISTTASTFPLNNPSSNETNSKKLPTVTHVTILPASSTTISGCESTGSDKLLTETAIEKPSSSTETQHSKSMPKAKEPIKLPPKKLLREHHMHIVHDDSAFTNAQIFPSSSTTIIVPQVAELVDVETKTLLDILKTVQSNEAACGAAECSDKSENASNTKTPDSPPKSPKSPKSPVGRSKKPTTAIRRYERRSKRGGEDETLHKTLEETFAEIAAQSSKAILEMYSNREADEESQDENRGDTKTKILKETQVDIKYGTLGTTTKEVRDLTTAKISEEFKAKTRKDTEKQPLEEKRTDETNVDIKEISKSDTIQETPLAKDVIHEEVTLKVDKNFTITEIKKISKKSIESNETAEKQKTDDVDIKEMLPQVPEKKDSITTLIPKDSTPYSSDTKSVDKMDVEKIEISDDSLKTAFDDELLNAPKAIEEPTQYGKEITEDITKPEEKMNPDVKAKLIQDPKIKEKFEAKYRTNTVEKVLSEKQANLGELTTIGMEKKSQLEKSVKLEETTTSEGAKSLVEVKPEENTKPISEENAKSLEEIAPVKQNKSKNQVITESITNSDLQTKSLARSNPEIKSKEEEITLVRSKHKEEVELQKELHCVEKAKADNKMLEAKSQVESSSSSPTKRGRKPKAKEKDSSNLQLEIKKSAGNRKAFVGEKPSTLQETEKKLEDISIILETGSNLVEGLVKNNEVPCTSATEISKMILKATKETEIKAVIENPLVHKELSQNLESFVEDVNISKEIKTDKCPVKNAEVPLEHSEANFNLKPIIEQVVEECQGQEQNLNNKSDTTRKADFDTENSISTKDIRSNSPEDPPKVVEKSSITKTEENNTLKTSPVASKKSEKSKEKSKLQLGISTTTSSSSDKIVPESTISSGDTVLPKPPPKKRYLKSQLQGGDFKDLPTVTQDKDLTESNSNKKSKKALAKLNTSVKEKLVPVTDLEEPSLPTSSKQTSLKTKQKRSMTPTDQVPVPTQSSSKKKSKKQSEESEQPVALISKIVDKKTSKKLDTKKFLESEFDADDTTARKKRQRKLKEAFEAALKEVDKNKGKDADTLASTLEEPSSVTTTSSIGTTALSILPIDSIITPAISGMNPDMKSTIAITSVVEPTPQIVGNTSMYSSTTTVMENTSSIIKDVTCGDSTSDNSLKHLQLDIASSLDRQTTHESPHYNMPLTPTNFDLRITPLVDESKNIEPTTPPKEVATTVIQPEEDPDDPLKDIEKFIEDGVNLLKRGYKIDNDEDDSVDGVVLNAAKKLVKEDLLSTPLKGRVLEGQTDLASITSFAETPADTPVATPSATPPPKSPSGPETPPPLSDDSFTISGGVRRSHRIKQNSKMPKALVGRGLVRDKERVSLKDDVETKSHYTIDDHRMDLAEVEAKNAKFLKDMEERLSNFRVIKENEYKCERIVSKEAKKMICDCFLTSEEEERGELGCGEDCLNRLLMIECGPDCNVKERCTNKRFQKFLCSPCRVFRTEKKGFGILADIEILPGEFIMEYVGEVINGDEFERRRIVYSLDKNRHYYFMALRSDAIIDATSKGNISRFINHSCDPNAETQKWTVNGELRIGFFSRKSIMPGEEITFDYQYQRYGREAQRCYCESSNCRGWIGEEPNSDEGEQIDDDSDGDEEEENLAESLLAEDDDDDDSDETDADADAEEAQKKLEKAAAEAKLTPMMEDEQKKQLLDTTAAGDDKRKKSDADTDGGVLDTSKEEDSKSKFKKLLSKMAEKVAKKKDKKERRRKQRTRRDEAGSAIKPIKPRFLEDPDIEDEVHFLSRCGLKNQSDTLRLSRLMVRAKLVQTRLNLLKILRSGELPCRRLFLDYHGLRLLHGWMSEDGGDLNIRMALLETLESLPIANKTVLKDSKVYQAVRNCCDNGASSSGESARSQSVSPSDESSKESTSGSQAAQPQEIPSELRKLASKLTATWDSLPEIFRIPKRERIEQMKEHEREADRQYAAVAATRGEEDKRRSYSSYDRYQRDRFGRSGPYGGGSNSSHRFAWSRGNGGGNGKETRNTSVLGGNGSNGDPRRRGGGGDSASHGSTDSTKHLSKEQRREMFAAKVARDEAEKRLAEERREFETKCRFFGLDPKKTRPQNLPFCVNPSTGQWYSADRQPIPTPPSYAHVQVPAKPKSTNPADYQLPATSANLSHKWKFAITPQGKIYYYHVKYRIPQWEPPTHEQMYGNSAMQAGGGGTTSNSDSGSDGLTNESTDDDDELIKGMEPARLQAYVDQKIEMRRQQRYNRLVGERSISPRREEDRIYNQMEVRKYKENKEKIRKRKEEIRRRRIEAVHNSTLNMCTLGRLDEVLSNTTDAIKSNKMEDDSILPIQDYLLSSDEEGTIKEECNNSPLIDKIVQGDKIVDELDALTSKRPLKRPLPTHRDFSSSSRGLSGSSTSSSPATYSSSSSSVEKHEQHKKRKLEKRELSKSGKKSKEQDSKYRKLKEKFRCEIAGIIVHHLKPYRKDACIIGRIQSNDDFNHLARKLTHFVMIKELKYCESVGQTLVVTESVKNKSREFIKKYMAKYGDVYVKPENDPDFKDIPFTLKI